MKFDADDFLKVSGQSDLWDMLNRSQGFLSNVEEGLTESEFEKFGRFWPFPIPTEVKEWFSISRNGNIGNASYSLADVHEGEYSPYFVFRNWHWKEKGWLVVGGDGCGDFYVVLTTPGPLQGVVAFVDQGDIDKLSYAVASNFTQWLRFLTYSERLFDDDVEVDTWPFNRGFVMKHDTGWETRIPRELDATLRTSK
jgi:hypothetical protein